jgi:hypothetical protein
MAIEKSLLRTNSTRKMKKSIAGASSRRYVDSSAVVKKVKGKGVVRISVGMHTNKSYEKIKRGRPGIHQSTTEKNMKTLNSSV